MLKFLVIGLGSMGKRRIRNLLHNNEQQIIGYDILHQRREEAKEKYGIQIIDDLKNLSAKSFDVMIISTLPDQHGDYIKLALKLKKHFFVEPSTSDEGFKDVLKNKNSKTVKAPSCTLRFYRPIKMIKKFLDEGKIGKILSFQYHMGQYLPDWHPYEDYRKVYFSKKNTGACREMLPFELTWLNWILQSEIRKISGYIGKVSDLQMQADDIISANVVYNNRIVGNIVIDVVSRKPFRTLRILGKEGVLEWENSDSVIKLYNAKSKTSKIIKIPKGQAERGYINEEEMYNEEIEYFLNAVKRKNKYPFTFAENQKVLNALYDLEKYHKNKK